MSPYICIPQVLVNNITGTAGNRVNPKAWWGQGEVRYSREQGTTLGLLEGDKVKSISQNPSRQLIFMYWAGSTRSYRYVMKVKTLSVQKYATFAVENNISFFSQFDCLVKINQFLCTVGIIQVLSESLLTSVFDTKKYFQYQKSIFTKYTKVWFMNALWSG